MARSNLMQPYSSAFKATGCGGTSGRHPAQKEPRDKETHRKPIREAAKDITRQFTEEYWSNVYPVVIAPEHSVVPLPVRMGYPAKRGVHMAK